MEKDVIALAEEFKEVSGLTKKEITTLALLNLIKKEEPELFSKHPTVAEKYDLN